MVPAISAINGIIVLKDEGAALVYSFKAKPDSHEDAAYSENYKYKPVNP